MKHEDLTSATVAVPDFVPAVPRDLVERYDVLTSNLTPIVRELAGLLDELDKLDVESVEALCKAFAGTDPELEDSFTKQWITDSGANRSWNLLAFVGIFPR